MPLSNTPCRSLSAKECVINAAFAEQKATVFLQIHEVFKAMG